MELTNNKQAIMTARTEGGIVEIATGWKTRQMGKQRFENTYDMYTRGKAPKIELLKIVEEIQEVIKEEATGIQLS